MTVASEREGILALPGRAAGTSFRGRVAMTFAQSAGRLAGSRLSTKLAMLLLCYIGWVDMEFKQRKIRQQQQQLNAERTDNDPQPYY